MEMWSRTCSAPVVEPDCGWARWPMPGDLKPEVTLSRLHTVSVTLEGATADRDEMREILRDALAHVDLRIANGAQSRFVLMLTVEATDVWLAVLMAMNAVTATGYVPIALTAEPVRHVRSARGG
jgi:hypothetical protein